jgi:hypothetical protein
MKKETGIKLRRLIERLIREESGVVGDMDKSIFKTPKRIGNAIMSKDYFWKMSGDTFGKSKGKPVDIYGIDYDNKEAMTDIGRIGLEYIENLKMIK